MSKLDKYIRLNIKMIGNCTGVACAMSLAIGLTAVNFAVIIFAVVFLGISIAALIKGYKRLYYTTLYEEAAYVYNSLPLDPKEVLAGKLFRRFVHDDDVQRFHLGDVWSHASHGRGFDHIFD